MYTNGMPTMYYADGTVVPEHLAMNAGGFCTLMVQVGLAHEVTEDGFWGVKDNFTDHWMLKVEDDGNGEAHWYVSTAEEDAATLASAGAS
jgi:hypothetical protein